MSKTFKRLNEPDFIKLIMMISVVLYHSSIIYMSKGWGPEIPVHNSVFFSNLAQYMNTFHVQTFTAMSGYLFYYLWYEVKLYNGVGDVLHEKVRRLIVPYLSASILWVIPFHVVLISGKFDTYEIIKKYVLGGSPSQLWFLLMLFWVCIIFSILCKRIDFSAASDKITLLILLILNYVSNVLQYVGVPNVYQILTAVKYMLFFYIGMLLRKNIGIVKSNDFKKYGLIAFGLSIMLFILYKRLLPISHEGGATVEIMILLLSTILNIAGILAVYYLLSSVANKINMENRLLKNIVSGSMVIYLFHQQLIYVSICLFNIDKISPVMLVSMNFILSVCGSYIIYNCLKKFKITRFLFGI